MGEAVCIPERDAVGAVVTIVDHESVGRPPLGAKVKPAGAGLGE